MINEDSLLFFYEFQHKLGWGRYHFIVNVNKRYRLRVASALKKRRHRNKNPFGSLILSSRSEGKIHLGDRPYYITDLRCGLMYNTCKILTSPIFFFFSFCKFRLSWPFDAKAADRGLEFVSVCEHSPSCHPDVFSYSYVSIFFPSPSPSSTLSLFFFLPSVFVHTQSAIIPPCRRDSGQ